MLIINHNQGIIRIKALIALIQLSRSTIYEKINPLSPIYDDSFPKPVKISVCAIGWPEKEVHAWIEQRMQSRQNKGAEA